MTGFAAMLGILGLGIGWWWADASAALFISFSVVFFLELKTKSIKLTFGVGTLIEIPSIFPLRSGITSPRDLVVPVVVGIIELLVKTGIFKHQFIASSRIDLLPEIDAALTSKPH